MKLWELGDTLKRVTERYNQTIDIIAFDVCFLGYIEAAYELRESVDHFIGSPDEVPDDGMEYDDNLEVLVTTPTITPRNYTIAEHYIAEYAEHTHYLTEMAIDIGALEERFTPAFETFANECYHAMYRYTNEMRTARNEAVHRNVPDLWGFVKNIHDNAALPSSLRSAAAVLLDAFNHTVLAHGEGASHPDSWSAAIHFPTYGADSRYRHLDFSALNWDEFLEMYADPRETGVHMTHAPLGDTESTDQPYELVATVTGEDLDEESVQCHYRGDEGFRAVSLTTTPEEDRYAGVIPPQPNGTTVYYYLSAADIVGNITLYPRDANRSNLSSLLSFSVGPDTVPPTVEHTPISDTLETAQQYRVEIEAEDNLGIDPAHILLYYRVNGTGATTVDFESCNPSGSSSLYAAFIPPQSSGTTVEYRIAVADIASAANIVRLPNPSDWYTFNITIPDAQLIIDISHGNNLLDYTLSSASIRDNYYQLAYTAGAIDRTTLDGYDLFISIAPQHAPSDEEVTAMREFVDAGGSIFFVAGSNSSVNSQFTGFASLIWVDTTADGEKVLPIDSARHSITAGCDAIAVGPYSSAMQYAGSTTPHTPLVEDNDRPLAAATSYGLGKLVSVADAVLDDAHIEDEESVQSGGEGIAVNTSNRIFGANIIRWLVTNEPPVAHIEPINATVDEPVVLDSAGSVDDDGAISTTEWYVDGEPLSMAPSVEHIFTRAGPATVQLVVTDNDGANTTATLDLMVNAPPIPNASGPTTGDRLHSMNWSSTSTDSDGDIAAITWHFDDGTVKSGVEVSHRYRTLGLHTTTLTVKDDRGSERSTTVTTTIFNLDPVANITTATDRAFEDEPIHLSASGSHDPDGAVGTGNDSGTGTGDGALVYSWTLGDGTKRYDEEITHAYARAGVYSVTLEVEDRDGARDATTVNIVVRNRAPAADAAFTHHERDPNTIRFDASVTNDTASDRRALNYTWQFGDGSVGYGPQPNHTYAEPGKYRVILTVTDDDGQRDMHSFEVMVEPDGDAVGERQFYYLLIVVIALAVFIPLLRALEERI